MFLNLVDEEAARMNQIFYVGNEMAVKRTDDQWPGLAAAQIQERYESKDQMEESWAFNTMFLFHTCFYSLGFG